MDIAQDEWRPGFARRTNDFAELVQLAANWRWREGMLVAKARSLVAVATPDLTEGERSVLSALLEHLSQKHLEASNAFVFPSARLLGMYCNKSESVIRERRARLEAKRYLIRDYNLANRPADNEAINLAPLFARLDELEQTRAEILAKNEAIRDSWKEQVVDISKYRAQAPEDRRLEQTQSNSKLESVTGESAAPPARSNSKRDRASPDRGWNARPKGTNPHRGGDLIANGSPKRARAAGPAKISEAALAKIVREELEMAVEACPELSEAVTPEIIADPSLAGILVERQLEQLARDLLPDPHRNNDLTVGWVWRRHGIRTAAMLAVALKSPRVVDPCRYFGSLAKSPPSNELDFRLNLIGILKWQRLSAPAADSADPASAQEAAAPPAPLPTLAPAVELPTSWPAAPGADHPTWVAIAEALRRRIGKGRFDTWFAPNVGFTGLEGGLLALTAPAIPADRIKREFTGHVLAAARDAGFKVDQLLFAVRRFMPR